MSKKDSIQIVKRIKKEIEQVLTELREKEYIRDENGISDKQTGMNEYEISYSGKTDKSSIVYDKHISGSSIMEQLLVNRQYSFLLFDKSIIQAEFRIADGEVIKERLVFMKKHNRIWTSDEINYADSEDVDWFADEEGIPVFLRVDYDPENHTECSHSKTHLTISNSDSCRIPIKNIVPFSEFMRFVLFHFYGYRLELPSFLSASDETITELEKKMIHLNWI